MKSRILILFIGFVFLWLLLLLRAASLQILPNSRLESLRDKQFQTSMTLNSRRGVITDRHGRDLALSTKVYSVFADPKLIESKKIVSKKIAKILDISQAEIYEKIKNSEKRFVWLQRLINKDLAENLKLLDIRGIQVVEEFKRIYPNDNLMAQTLGLVGLEGQGLEGLEYQYDQILQSNKKKVTVRRDARGRPLIADGIMFTEHPDGAEIKLTIDSEMQHMLENELSAALSEFNAEAAHAVILDANTSAILALTTAPLIDANKAVKATASQRRNRVVTDAFEPGSTMKTFVIASALREKIIAPNTTYNTEKGLLKIGNRFIHEAEMDHRWSTLQVSEILSYSSNIGTTKIAFDLGSEALRAGLRDFGFGAKTGVDFPGEAKGTLLPLPWIQHLLANISFGHGISASPLQIANAYAAIANGGILNTPYLVQSTHDIETGIVTEIKPKQIRRVLSETDAAAMRLMLNGVTSIGGTGINARVEGFPVAGKTGTAQKVNPTGRGYLPQAYISSFAGFIPANNPKFVIYVAIDHPKTKNKFYGSQVAAPIFSRIASYAVRQSGIAPTILSEKNLPQPSDLGSKKISTVTTENENQIVPEFNFESNVVPDLYHLTMREVIHRLRGQKIKIQFQGTGLVSEIEPQVGSPLPVNQTIKVILK